MTLLGEWIHFCEAKENVNKYWFSKMPYRVFLVSESRKRIVIWINNNTVFAIIFNRFLKQVSLQKSNMHILLPYWMQPSRGVPQNASSKQFSKILRKNL